MYYVVFLLKLIISIQNIFGVTTFQISWGEKLSSQFWFTHFKGSVRPDLYNIDKTPKMRYKKMEKANTKTQKKELQL